MFTDKQISKNFWLHEFINSDKANSLGIKEQYNPPQSVIDNIIWHVVNVLQPLRNLLPDGIMHISSGYRCPSLNKAVGGVSNSEHLCDFKRCGTDVEYYEKDEDGNFTVQMNLKLHDTLKSSNIQYDQTILEKGTRQNPDWIHIGSDQTRERREDLTLI